MKVTAKLSDSELNTLREARDVLETIQDVIVSEDDEIIDGIHNHYDTTGINDVCDWFNNFLKLL